MRWCCPLVLLAGVGLNGVPASAFAQAVQDDAAAKPATAPAFRALPLGQIKPSGWLRDQLEIQAKGLSGSLDEFWPDIKESAWIGGKAEGWERVPYWLDGLIPLAYQLDDAQLQAKVKVFIDYILEHQQPDGWLGPIGDSGGHKPYDPWPLFPLFKAFEQYQEATGDPRIVPALQRCAHKIHEVVDQTPLYSWAKMRAADFAVTLFWLHERTGDATLLELARKAFAQSHDWRAAFEDFKFTERSATHLDLDNHGVNVAMGLKYGVIRSLLTGDPKDRASIEMMLEKLDHYHGQATGIYTCDEHLGGRNPSQGTELCTVVEALYSLELVASVTGSGRIGDRIESLAFNALPATFKKDMSAHQYDQQTNQVICSRAGEHVYTSNGPDSNLYGLEPNFGCCTANYHQGWPKLTSSLWMASADDGLAAVAYAPCVLAANIQGKAVKLEVSTDYPFRDVVQITVTVPEPMKFPLHLRIPAWTTGAVVKTPNLDGTVDGTTAQAGEIAVAAEKAGGYVTVQGEWTGVKTISLQLPMPVRLREGFNDSVSIHRGPLVYALGIGAEWKKLKDNPRFADWEVYPTTPWNYALAIDRDHPEQSIQFEERPLGHAPFSEDGAPVNATVKGRQLAAWTIEKGAAAPPPQSPVESDAPTEDLTLIPYGCTDLRITEFPVLRDR